MTKNKLLDADWDNLVSPDKETADWFLEVLGKSAPEEEPRTWAAMICQVARDLLTDFDGEEPGAGGHCEIVKDDSRPD